jgi:hypothetical protein
MTTDFAFMTRVSQGFFAKKVIKDTLSLISECEISGWEKWIQIEFAKYCNSHAEITDWGRELRYKLDRRSSKTKASCAIDLLIKQKHKHSPLALEIKQQRSAKGCIKSMLRDKAKLRKVKWSEDDLRGVWCLGVHAAESPDSIKNLVVFCAREQKIEIKESQIFSRRVGRTEYSVTLF